MTDQLELHMKKDDEVAAGTVSQEDADDECEEWSKVSVYICFVALWSCIW